MRPVLRIPAYRRLLAAYALNELAFMIGSVALALLVYRRTGSALGTTAFFLSAQFIARADLADGGRATRPAPAARVVLPVLHWFEALIFVVLAWVASDHFSVAAVLLLAFLDGVVALVRAGADADRDGVGHLGCRSPARRQRGRRTPPSRCASCSAPAWGARWSRPTAPASRCWSTRGIFALCGFNLLTAPGLPEPAPSRAPAKGRVRAALAYARERPSISGLLLLQAVRRAVLRDLGSGRGRVRPAFAARRRGGLRRDGLRLGSRRGGRSGHLRPVARASLPGADRAAAPRFSASASWSWR